MKLALIAEAQPVGVALVRRDSAYHASMLALAASSILAVFTLQKYEIIRKAQNKIQNISKHDHGLNGCCGLTRVGLFELRI